MDKLAPGFVSFWGGWFQLKIYIYLHVELSFFLILVQTQIRQVRN